MFMAPGPFLFQDPLDSIFQGKPLVKVLKRAGKIMETLCILTSNHIHTYNYKLFAQLTVGGNSCTSKSCMLYEILFFMYSFKNVCVCVCSGRKTVFIGSHFLLVSMNVMVLVAALPYYLVNRRVPLENLCTKRGEQVIMGKVLGKYTLPHKKHTHTGGTCKGSVHSVITSSQHGGE